ncbi:hypothetical protein [Paraburkholderia acidiphila]|uniref:Uncharacterized protein n=1 Tax=Paraburkholderia acidiphila TaxID=2571747 RepID=A0A7Z2G1H8_9BURK|nr:hypothetical protein [Paraburkholderia acidiphila]QGZ53490.1 hypothetical protein FAZ97_00445 [Paraburkholderia acidiphila]
MAFNGLRALTLDRLLRAQQTAGRAAGRKGKRRKRAFHDAAQHLDSMLDTGLTAGCVRVIRLTSGLHDF